MSVLSIVLIAFALSLDAFAVSISCGIKLEKKSMNKSFKIAFFFGLFQAIMPLIGWSVGHIIRDFVTSYSSWIAFTVFMALGIKTIYDAFTEESKKECLKCSCDSYSCVTGLAVATSIDALVVGLVFSIYNYSIMFSIIVIGVLTFIVSIIGCILGNKTHNIIGNKAHILAGLILITLSFKAAFGL